MALTVSATNSELKKPINTIFEQTFLRRAAELCPYFLGTKNGTLTKHSGTATVTWRRFTNLSASTSAISELQVEAAYMQARSAAALATTEVSATVSKYGNFVILSEEADLFNFNGQTDEILDVIGHNAGKSLNQLQRNIGEDNLTFVYVGGVASNGAVTAKITRGAIQSVVNTLEKNSAIMFTPRSNGNKIQGSTPLLDAFWGLTHPDVAVDISQMAGFKPVEAYMSHTNVQKGEFGAITVAGRAVRFISSEDASVAADAGATLGSTGLNGTSSVDTYSTLIYGKDCLGSLGFGERYKDGIFTAGDKLGPFEIIHHKFGSGGTSDPYNEISTIAWKAWHTGAVLNSAWGRTIQSGASKLNV